MGVAFALSLLTVIGMSPAPAAPSRPAPPDVQHGRQQFRPGELIVKARPGRTPGLKRALARSSSVALRRLGQRTSVVRVPVGQEEVVAAALALDPNVAYAEPNYLRSATAYTADELTWGVRRMQAPQVWNRATSVTGNNVRVAVIDSGVDQRHPQLAGRVKRGLDLYGGVGRDRCGHGTAVAGVIAAAADGAETVGVAPEADIVPVKVLEFDAFDCVGSDADIARGLKWAARQGPDGGRADIINLSLSGPQRSSLLRDAVQFAVERGVLVVAAAGNTGDREVQYPGAYPDVISVGGIERRDGDVRWWPNSSYAAVDVVAAARAVPVITARHTEPEFVGRPCRDRPGTCADGTSFAAPHVAGAAALLAELHDLDALHPAARIRRLRQWLLATAPRVPGRRAGMDIKTGHGEAVAANAVAASENPSRTLLTWRVGSRVLVPNPKMVVAPSALPASFVATTGTGGVLSNQRVSFSTAPGGSVTQSRTATSSTGRAATVFRSTAGGRTTRLVAHFGTHSLPMDVFVLQRDENAPGVPIPASPFRNSLRPPDDVDDVFRVYLRAGETIRARLARMRGRGEYGDLYLHRGSTRDVTNPYYGPLSEPSPYDNDPRVLRRTVRTDGRRYLDVFGRGTYRLHWSIYSPNVIRDLDAAPWEITPNGDGDSDRARLSWRLERRGRVQVLVRDLDGDTLRRYDLGAETRGRRTWRWNGRVAGGEVARPGTYRLKVVWSRGPRVSVDSTRVAVRR